MLEAIHGLSPSASPRYALFTRSVKTAALDRGSYQFSEIDQIKTDLQYCSTAVRNEPVGSTG
jgi:hypothetical protein